MKWYVWLILVGVFLIVAIGGGLMMVRINACYDENLRLMVVVLPEILVVVTCIFALSDDVKIALISRILVAIELGSVFSVVTLFVLCR